MKLHCGLAPYHSAIGKICASYQLLNHAGQAIASVSFVGDAIAESAAIDTVDLQDFIQVARRQFAADSAQLA